MIDVMQKLLSFHRGLLQLAEQKTEAIKKGDIHTLQQMMTKEQKYVMAIRQLESERMGFLSHLPEEERTVSRYAEQVEENERATLLHLADELSVTVTRLKEQNELNMQLLQQSLQFIHFTLDLMIPNEQDVTYDPKRADDLPPRSSFEAKT
ncbi:flagellar protein FlgN [Anoxybacillus flavithermus]|uniref:Flagellar protein FlgN n=2 Tax=Anoxybacillaceae TaxID=3120669 RepID=A0A2G5RPM7_9BACL|nr:flagellar biosynthesis protein FlgN [Anoxybacillus sp. KU2-6(11)]PIC04683.1 flagellar protein FlgN [Anoxybacillus flavithermus]